MHFNHLKIDHWQQFDSIDLEIHDRVTILTGANGAGKTTILNILARHSGWPSFSLALPKQETQTGLIRLFSRLFRGEDKSDILKIGEIIYSNDNTADLAISGNGSVQYEINILRQQNVSCFFVPSHKTTFRYQQISNIPTAKKSKGDAFQEVSNTSRDRYLGGSGQSPSFFMKNTLIGWVINGYGVSNGSKKIMPADSEQIQNFVGFQDVLRKILPKSLGFQEIEIRNMEIVFVCNDGNDEFLLETASGGVSAIIDIAWQIFMFSNKENSDFTVIIDEIENHLHPTMQRNILYDLTIAFPYARFIVSTHSPLVISSVKESSVYALKYNDDKKIVSQKLDLVNKPKTASEILDEVLGISFTMPIWIETDIQRIINNFSTGEMTTERFAELRSEMTQLGLEKMLPFTIGKVIEAHDDKTE